MHDPGYWRAWIGLYTGARLGEIAQSLTEAVHQLYGVSIHYLTREFSILKVYKDGGISAARGSAASWSI